MNILSHYLGRTEGMAIFPIIGVFIFFSFFLFLIYYVMNLDKGLVKDMENLPLTKDAEEIEDLTNTKEFQHGEE